MADKNGKGKGGKDKQYADDLRDLLHDLGAFGDYSALIDKAVRGSWSSTQFEVALRRSKPFQNAFRGLVTKNGDFTKQFMDQGITSLATAIQTYRRMSDAYTDAAKAFGVKVKGARLEQLFRSEVSPDEFGIRVAAINSARSNPGLMDKFNEQLRAQGRKPLDKIGFFKFLAGSGSRQFYDTYQAAYLRDAGLDLTTQEAKKVARTIDSPLQPNMDLGKLVAEINRIKPDIAPELTRAGISDADLALLAAGQDPKNLAGKLEQITNQRRAMGQGPPGTYAGQSSTGGMSIYPEEQAGGY